MLVLSCFGPDLRFETITIRDLFTISLEMFIAISITMQNNCLSTTFQYLVCEVMAVVQIQLFDTFFAVFETVILFCFSRYFVQLHYPFSATLFSLQEIL